jgi:predicted glycosyltransferase
MSSILISVTHLLGAGHLTRAATIGRALVAAGHRVTLVTGGKSAELTDFRGLSVIQLPVVQGTFDLKSLLDEHGNSATEDLLSRRRAALVAACEAAAPDVVITELFPFGRRLLANEFDALLRAACSRNPRPLIVSSIRDIVSAPSKPSRLVDARRRLATYYHAVLFHGDPTFLPLDVSWPVDDALHSKLHATGYVDGLERVPAGPPPEGRDVLVSGGSSGAAIRLYAAALAAAPLVPDLRWRFLVGGGVAEGQFDSLVAAASGNVKVERARSDFRVLLRSCAVSVSQCGYNTAVDILRTGPLAVFVPFEGEGETEQRLRAERLSAMGFGEVVLESELSPETLASAVRAALNSPMRSAPQIRLDGAERTVATIETLLESSAQSSESGGADAGRGC